MGTRSIINVFDYGKPIVAIYQQYDGYPEGVGKDLAKYLCGITMVNGFSSDQGEKPGAYANGVECLAAQLVVHLKTSVGGTYLTTPGSDSGQEYEYDVTFDDDVLRIECFETPYNEKRKSLFKGSPKETLEWCTTKEPEA